MEMFYITLQLVYVCNPLPGYPGVGILSRIVVVMAWFSRAYEYKAFE